MTILVRSAEGFIGSNFVLDWFDNSHENVEVSPKDLLGQSFKSSELLPLKQ